MKTLFETNTETLLQKGQLDNRLNASEVLFVVFVLGRRLERLTFTTAHPKIEMEDEFTQESYHFEVKDEGLFLEGEILSSGLISAQKLKLFVVPNDKVETKFVRFAFNGFTFSNSGKSPVEIKGDAVVHLELDTYQSKNEVTIHKNEDLIYVNHVEMTNEVTFIEDFTPGSSIFTTEFYLERRTNQWKLTWFTDDYKILRSEMLYDQGELPEFPTDFPDYRRSPRLLLELPTEQINVEKIGTAPQERKNSLIKTILPPLGMLVAGMVMSFATGRSPLMMLGTTGISLLTAIFTVTQYFTDKKGVAQKLIDREEDYEHYLMRTTSRISLKHQEETKVLHYQHPDPEALAQLALSYDARIYERMTNNKDFLEVTLGSCELPTNLTLDYPNDPQEKDPDALRVQEVMEKHFTTQKNVPTKLEVMNQTLGFVGTYDVLKTQVANLLFQLAFFQSCRDVNFITLVPESSYEEDWERWNFLPHTTIQELQMRGIIHDAKSRDQVLNSFYRELNARKEKLKEAGRDKQPFSPYYVLTIFDDSYLAGHGINELLATDTSEFGMTVIYCREDQRLLPETVTALVEYYNSSAGHLVNDHTLHVEQPFRPYAEVPDLENALRRLANLNHVEVEKNAIPSAVTFLELYKAKKVEDLAIAERWQKANASKTLAVPLGLRGKDDIEMLNLHERGDGPHGIFGGTTGAGKSELAQSLLLSLAVNFAPEDVSFLIIDFKGGGMSALFRKLPHLTGEITNLDRAGVQRAITAYQAEIDKRQRYFDQYGVNSINDYTKLYKQGKETPDKAKYPTEPLPHLIIVGDETAELKAQAPEFLEVLVSGARVGRSLGIHQFLGTQSPAGVISEQIWDNSKFKLSLRMADETASKSILKTPDAAYLSASEPGRAYLKVGTAERYELFQSAFSAADYEPDKEVQETEDHYDDSLWEIDNEGQVHLLNQDLSEQSEEKKVVKEKYTELDAVVDYIADLAEQKQAVIPAKPWLPLLEERIITPPVEAKSERNTKIPLGLMDIPSKQSQETYYFDIQEASHTAIFSSPGYGKSTTLQTIVMNLARQNTPEQVQFNLLDFGTNGLLPLKDLPHVSDIVSLEEDEKLQKMLNRIAQTLKERSELFKENDVVTLSQYQAKTKEVLPIIVSLFDGYDSVRENKNSENVEAVFNMLVRDGASLGLYAIATANRVGAFYGKTLANVKTRLALYLSDKQERTEAVGQRSMDASAISGRGQLIYHGLTTEIQIFTCTDTRDGLEYVQWFNNQSEQLSNAFHGKRPEPIPMVPQQLAFEMLPKNIQLDNRLGNHRLFLGLSQVTTLPQEWLLNNEVALFVAMDSEEQMSVFFQLLLKQLPTNHELETILIDLNGDFPAYREYFDRYIDEDLTTLKTEIMDAISNPQEDHKLYYFADIESAFSELRFTEPEVKQLLKRGSHQAHFIFQAYNTFISNAYDNVMKLLRSRVNLGLFGVRLSEQKLVPVLKLQSGEEYLQENELYVYMGRKYDKLRLPMEVE